MGIVVSNSRNVTNVVFNFFISQRFYSLVFNSILYSEKCRNCTNTAYPTVKENKE